MEAIKGYCVLTDTISGPELVWRTGEHKETMPEVFESERAAYLEILDDLQDGIEQFKEGVREWEEIHWPGDEYIIDKIIIYTDGEMMVYHGDDDAPQPVLITSLTAWREGL